MAGATVACAPMARAAEPATAPGVNLFVATTGNDAWSGRLSVPNPAGTDGPFATLDRARNEIRVLKQQGGLPAGGIVVEVLGGRYELTAPVVLTAEDSGPAEAPIVFQGRPGAEVRISGGKIVTGWQPVTDPAILERLDPVARGKVFQADLKAQGVTEFGDLGLDAAWELQLWLSKIDGQGEDAMGSTYASVGKKVSPRLEVFLNDTPMDISRWPNEGFIKIEAVLGSTERDVRGWKSCVEGIFQYEGDRPRRWVGEKDAWVLGYWGRDWALQRHKIKTLDPEKRVIAVEPPYHTYGYHKGQWFCGLNLLCEIDRPGEWYIDREAGILYLWPTDSLDKSTVEVSMASGLFTLTDASYVTIRGLLLEAARGTAVAITGGEQCRVIGCTFRNLGNHAVTVFNGKEHGVIGCDMYGMGGGGIYLVGGDRKELTPAGHFAENNHIHHYARWDRMYRPGIFMSGVGLRASHNLIHDAPHSAILFGGNDHLFEYNEIHNVCQESHDCGAIYAGRSWTLRGHVMQYNYIHHLAGKDGGACNGIYLDDLFSSATIQGNVFYQVLRPVFIGGGRDNIVQDNVFVDCPKAMHVDARALGWCGPHADGRIKEAREKGTIMGVRYKEPPFSTRYPQLVNILDEDPKSPCGNIVRRNIFWLGNGENIRRVQRGEPPTDTWWDGIEAKIRPLVKLEDNLINEDPKFVDEKACNFQLRDDSPAWKLGFKRIPVEKIGLHPDDCRASWPVTHAVRPLPSLPALPAAPPPRQSLRTGPAPVFAVARAVAPITIDGQVTPAEWAGADPKNALVIERGLYHEPLLPKSYAWFAYDDRNLYVAVVNDVDTVKPLAMGAHWGTDDAVEVALRNPAAGKTAPIFVLRGYPNGRFESSPEAGAPGDQVQKAGAAVTFAASVVDAALWAAEYQIPLDVLGLSASAPAKLEMNISVRKSAGAAWVMWQGTGGLTWETGKAGFIELSK
ncbi:MAG: hypothetical protein A3K19_04975 [Lentisphaerae bacterium RIFOXYB12_FULL_65_16]|nr:MAG: hypothetical protein A3K19_04975 [Lentisphaerae bacterium RIFOXYB12_FULL_65_16]